LWHKAFKNSRYTEGYACEFLKTFSHQHLSTPHPQKSLNSGLNDLIIYHSYHLYVYYGMCFLFFQLFTLIYTSAVIAAGAVHKNQKTIAIELPNRNRTSEG
jgi:hypothetical protein